MARPCCAGSIAHLCCNTERIQNASSEDDHSTDPEILGGYRGVCRHAGTLLDLIEGADSLNVFLDNLPSATREQAVAFLNKRVELCWRKSRAEGFFDEDVLGLLTNDGLNLCLTFPATITVQAP